VQHDYYQARPADRLLQQKNVVVRSKIHRLRDDAVVGMRLAAGRLPPKIFAAEFGDRFPGNVIHWHS
jgi:hypothetical protein